MIAELMRHREVLSTLVEKDFKSRYKAKALGRLWSIADPLVMIVIYTVVFVHILQVAEPFYPIFLLLGLTPYRFFGNAVNGAASAVNDNVQLVKKVAFPRVLLPLSVVLSHARHFFIELSLVAALFLYFPEAFIPGWHLLWLPVVFAVELTCICGIALSVAALNVRYRDTQYILNSALLILYWLTPIFYAFRTVPPRFAKIMMWNPLVGIVEGFRSILMHGSRPSLTLLGAAGLTSLALLAVGLLLFRHYQNVFSDYI
jgi:ABC-2 type transport system permease protein